MKRRKSKTMANTSVGVYLALNIEVQRDGKRPQFFAIPLLSLTTWLIWWWGVDRVLQCWVEGMARRLVGTWLSLSVALIILAIGWTAVRYGLGLKV